MNFLKKLFKRSSDEEEDDFEDEEDFGFDEDGEDDDRPRTQVIMDDDDDGSLDEASGGDEHFGMGSDLSGDDDDDGPVTMGGDTYNVEVDDSVEEKDDDVDFDDFDDDDDIDFGDDEDDEEGDPSGGSRKKLVFAAIGAGVLILGIAGGGAFWFLGGDDTEQAAAQSEPTEGGIQMALPPRAGSLNALSVDQDAGVPKEPEPEQPAQPEQAEETPETNPDAEEAQPSATENQISSAATLGSTSLNALAGSGAAGQGVIIPSVTAASFRKVRDKPNPTPLASAPDRRLLEQVAGLERPLPSISKDGNRRPWEVYARPLTGNEQGQRVGVLVTGLGLSRAATMAAINKLPGEFSLVFEPYAKDLDDWLLRARLAGHEVFVGLPMESEDFPAEDPGPLGLTTTVQVAENMKRLHGVLSSFSGYVGVVSLMGSKFSKAEGQLKPILTELKKRGLMFVDGGAIVRSVAPRIAAEIDLPRAKSNLTLDEPPSPGNISRKLRQLEKLIKDNATAIATIRAYPSSIEKLAEWAGTLADKQLALVPVSAIANKQFIE